ncbi:MAG: PGRS family protein [Polyangiaceae bacterium]
MTRSPSRSQPFSFGARHLLAVLIATAPLVAACDGDLFNDTSWTYNVCPVDEGPSAASCVLDAAPGIFVRGEGDDDASGAREAPVRTVGQAITLAAANGGPQRVYICAQSFAESIKVPSGLRMFGGLDCADGWRWQSKVATEIAPPMGVPITLLEGAGTTLLHDITARAADATEEGTSSIALMAIRTAAELERCFLIAGKGARGLDGALQAAGEAGEDGNSAGAPGDSCAASGGQPIPGGDTTPLQCADGQTSMGGAGGDSPVDSPGDPGQAGTPGDAPGGQGEPTIPAGWTCESAGNGANGANGVPGESGAGADSVGELTEAGFIGAAGAPGKTGQVGRCVGGGGASSGKVCGASAGGAGGGAGGTGGCGGAGSLGGGGGGSSIAVASVDAHLALRECALRAAMGGPGGAGGDGMAGGDGGQGAPGGNAVGGAAAGCKGGDGGAGGPGGAGGGGRGGHSVGIAFVGPEVVWATTAISLVDADDVALGGAAGAGSTNNGAQGLNTPVLDLTPPGA